jgi:hypothetical protein
MNDSVNNLGNRKETKNDELGQSQAGALTSISSSEAPSPSRRIVLGGIAGAALASINSACSKTPEPSVWDEEVQLADGRVIVVRQKRGGEFLYDGHRVNAEATKGYLKFLLPEIQAAHIEWSDAFMPLILNVHEGIVYVGGSPFIGRNFQEFQRPRSGWVVQRYNPTTKKWERIPASKTPEPIRKTNLLVNLTPPPDLKLMTLAIKASEQYNGRVPKNLPYVRPLEIHPEMLSLDPSRKSEWAQAMDDQDLTD